MSCIETTDQPVACLLDPIGEKAKEILRTRDRLNRLFAKATGQPLERIEEDTHRNFWLDAAGAQRYGLVGRVIERADDLVPAGAEGA